MTLYEIDAKIASLIDENTGEIANFEEFNKITLERETKIENIVCFLKNEQAMAAALDDEIKVLSERKQAKEKSVKRLKELLIYAVPEGKFESVRAKFYTRKSQSVEIENEDNFIQYAMANGADELLRYKKPEINKTAVKQLLKQGEVITGASLKDNVSVIVR